MTTFLQDVRYGVRNLISHKSFSLVAVAALALGIGVNTVMFSAFDAVMLKALPYPDPDRVVTVWDTYAQVGADKFGVAYANFVDMRARTGDVFEPLAIYQAQSNTSFNLTGLASPERLQGARVTGDFFRALGVSAMLGRTIEVDDEAPGRNRVVVVSHDFWRRALGADPQAVNRVLELNGDAFRIIGVMPPGFTFPSGKEMPVGQQFPNPTELWAPLTIPATSSFANDRIRHPFRVVGRLKAGVTIDQAQQRAAAVMQQLVAEHRDDNEGLGVSVLTIRENQIASVRPVMVALLAAVGLVLLIACTNVANLLLSRASMRQKEFAVRASLGAGRGRLVRQLLTESLVLACAGGVCGLIVSAAGLRSVVATAPADLPHLTDIAIDGRTLAFTAFVTLVTGVLFGLAPALQATRTNLFESIKGEGRTSAGSVSQRRLRNVLVAAQVVLVFVLLAAAGLLLQSVRRLQAVPAGFDPSQVLTARVTLPAAAYSADRKLQFYRDLLERLGRVPGVREAAVVRDLPLGGTDPRYGIAAVGRPAPPSGGYTVRMRIASERYFTAMGIVMRQGRSFDARDGRGGAGVAILNEAAARQVFPGETAVGKMLQTFNGFGPERVEVIGVSSDVRFSGLDTTVEPEIFIHTEQVPESFLQAGIGSMAIVLKANANALSLAEPMRRAVAAVDPNVPVNAVEPMHALLDRSLASRHFNVWLITLFGVASLVLASVGIYGVLSYWVSQRGREIGTRMALGAQSRDVFGLVVFEAMRVVLIGLGLGLVTALVLGRWLTRVMPGMLYGVSSADPFTLVVTASVLLATALAACVIPARRAVAVDPMQALRPE